MRIKQKHEEAILSDKNMKTGIAGIEMSPHMASILSKGLYERPEEAVIRETTCNAYDGMTAAGKKGEAVHVHLPTPLEPYFEVQDYGIGMSEEDVMSNYLIYGHSTKTGNNNEIGGLGLGCKSPFAIVSSFTVRSRFEGIETTYSLYSDGGLPKITKLTSKPTEKCSGITVRFAVPRDMISTIVSAALDCYQYFVIKPKLNIDVTYSVNDNRKIMSDNKTYSVYKNTKERGLMVRMGQVAYPIPTLKEFSNGGVSLALDHNWGGLLILDIPIGSVDVAASRESVQLSNDTIKFLSERFKEIDKKILTDIQTETSKKENLYEVLADGCVPTSLYSDITFKGKTLRDLRDKQIGHRRSVSIDKESGKKTYTNLYPDIFWINYSNLNNSKSNDFKRITTNLDSDHDLNLFSMPWLINIKRGLVVILNDLKTKKGTIQTVGRVPIIRKVLSQVSLEGNGGCLYTEFEEAIESLTSASLIPKSQIKVIKMSDYKEAYVPQKRISTPVVNTYIDKGGRSHTFDLSSLPDDDDNVEYYVKVFREDIASENLSVRGVNKVRSIFNGDKLFVIKKTNWNKIPDYWVEITDEHLVERLLEIKGQLWRNTNIEFMLKTRYAQEQLGIRSARQLGINLPILRKSYEESDISYRMSFEDYDQCKKQLGRLKMIFPEEYLQDFKYEDSLLTISDLLFLLPFDKKLQESYKKTYKKVRKSCKNAVEFMLSKNQLLKFINWKEFNFSQIKQYL